MKFRHQLLWILCAALVWAGAMYLHRPAQAAGADVGRVPSPGATAAVLDECRNQDNRGRYQLVMHPDGILIFDTATAEAWTRIPPATNWTHIDAPPDIQQRHPGQMLTNIDKDPLGLFKNK